jgi:RNA polymerase sigma-70 factor (ECF subfamily)
LSKPEQLAARRIIVQLRQSPSVLPESVTVAMEGQPSHTDAAADESLTLTPTVSPQASTQPAIETEVSDNALIERVVADDDMEAWETLMARYSSRAYQIAYGVLGHHNDCEEVAQDAFVRIYRALPNFRGDSEFSTWMYRIVVNQARNKYRWNKRRGANMHVSIDEERETRRGSLSLEIPDHRVGPDGEVVCREWEGEISREMAALPEVNREALILRNIEHMSYEQIAEVLGCKIGTVKSRIARGREELRKRLAL